MRGWPTGLEPDLLAPSTIRSIGVPAGVRPLSLLLGQGGDELAAEVGGIGDHTAPEQV
jgi:hypothetical protein